MKLDSTDAKTKKNSSNNFTNTAFDFCTVHTVHYLRIFAWSHECFTEVKSSSSTNLCLIPHKALSP